MLPPWSNFTRAIMISICLVFSIWLLYTIRPMIGPLIIAALLAYVLNPLVRLVHVRARMRREWAVPTVFFSGLAVLIIIPSVLAPTGIRQASRVATYLLNIETQLETTLAQPVHFMGQTLFLGQMLADFIKRTTEMVTPAAEQALLLLETTSTNLIWLLVILAATYSFLLNGDALREWLIGLAPHPAQTDVRHILQEVDGVWRAYIQGTFVLMLIVAIVFTIVWFAIGLPGALILGILMGLLTIIPDVGPAIGALLSVLVAYFQGSDFLPLSNFWFAVLVFSIYFVLIQIKSIWLRPRIMSSSVRIHPAIIFIAIVGSLSLAGVLTALIIVPVLGSIAVISRYTYFKLFKMDPWADEAEMASKIIDAGDEKTAEPSSNTALESTD